MQTLPEALEHFCRRHESRIHLEDAFAASSRRMTFGELLQLAARGATFLQEQVGSAPSNRIGILCENCSAWMQAYHAAAWAGFTLVPLDARQAEDEIVAILTEADLSLLLVSPAFQRFAGQAVRRGLAPRTLTLDDELVARFAACPPAPPAEVGPDSPLSIIYTSGTTGRSKGVVLTHGNVLNQALQNVPAVGADEETRILAILPLNHIFVFAASIIALVSGGRLVFIDSLQPDRVVKALKTCRITHMAGIPLLYDAMLKGIVAKVAAKGKLAKGVFNLMHRLGNVLQAVGLPGAARALFRPVHREFAPSIRTLICGGARCRPQTVRGFLAMGYNFQEGYGLTETTGGIICNPFRGRKSIGTVGRPFGDTELRIETPAPGGEGEIWIRGKSVFAGYFRDPAATASVMAEGNWFRTGDLGRLDASGNLSITGRAKELIILPSGKNISPEELEDRYTRSPLIEEAAALGITENGHERIHLVVVPAEAARRQAGPGECRALVHGEVDSITRRLASYKRPQGVTVRLEPLPRTSTRKIRRQELLRSLSEQPHGEAGQPSRDGCKLSLADREVMCSREMGEILTALAQVVDEVPDPAELTPASHLFLDLGLDSIQFMELLTCLEKSPGLAIPAEKTAAIQTLGELCRALHEAETASERAPGDWKAALRRAGGENIEFPVRRIVRKLAAVIEPLDYGFIRLVGRGLYRLRAHNLQALPASGPYILAPNHASYFDYPSVAGILPSKIRSQAYVIGKKQVYGNPFGRLLSTVHRVIPVDRDGDFLPALQAGASILRFGKILFMHPEGKRTEDGRMKPLKQGVAILSREIDVPVVPVYIHGTYEVYPKGRKLPRLFQLRRFRRFRVEVYFGDPVNPSELPTEPDPYRPILQRIESFMTGMEARLHGSCLP